jgi:hypothetical protein
MDFSKDELRVLLQALNEIIHGPGAIEEPEFGTRMGTTREKALKLMDRVEGYYNNK